MIIQDEAERVIYFESRRRFYIDHPLNLTPYISVFFSRWDHNGQYKTGPWINGNETILFKPQGMKTHYQMV